MSSLATILKELLLQGTEQAKRHHSFRAKFWGQVLQSNKGTDARLPIARLLRLKFLGVGYYLMLSPHAQNYFVGGRRQRLSTAEVNSMPMKILKDR